MKKYLLTLAFLSASFSFIGAVVAQELPACTCLVDRGPQVPCDMKKDKINLFKGRKLEEHECIWNCHCAPVNNNVCVTSGAAGEELGHCMPY